MAHFDDSRSNARTHRWRTVSTASPCAQVVALISAAEHRTAPVAGEALLFDVATRTIRWSPSGIGCGDRGTTS